MLAADGSLNAHHCAVGRHARGAEDTLGTTVGEPLRAHKMAQRLLAGGRVGNGNEVQYVHVVFGFVVVAANDANHSQQTALC